MTGNPLDHFQRARINFIQYRLHLSKAGVLPSLRENFSVLTSRPVFIAKMPFSLSQEKNDRGEFDLPAIAPTEQRTSQTG